MPPPAHTKPENVLKRAQELIAVDQTQAALQILYEHVTSKRSRNSPIPSLEPVMLLFVELCVDLRKGKLAKDGLYQYKNVAQNTNVGTIELVLKKFIELADQKVAEAQSKADAVQSTLETTGSTSNIDDLEASETPESILLSTVSGEQSKDRTDRAIVTPWLKFLWETYRTVLDILRNNARLEVMYQSTALQAFQFCLKFTRKTEFRRLCELLRNHVQNAAKYSSQMNAIDLSDPDTLQRHLDTRFQQLNVAVDLELWQEGFRSVEDIHTLLSLSKRQPKNIMMANYYEKLTRIFLVSENYLFHAAAWNRYYNLLRASMNAVATGQATKKDSPATTEADITKAASFVLLSALAIPVISTQRSRGALVDIDEAKKNKNVRLTNLLNMPKAPTRASLFKDALSKGLLKRAKPEIRELYNILEVDFHPLSICKKISPILQQIASDPEMEKYVAPLQQVILTRLFQQLSQVYDTVDLQFVITLAQFPAPYEISSAMIEKFVMNGCKKGDLSIRVDHAAGFISFDSDVFSAKTPASAAPEKSSSVQKLQSTPSEIVRTQLSRLSQALWTACQYVDPAFNQARADAKKAAYERAAAAAEKERAELLARREIIDQKKAAASSALALRQKEEQNRKKQQELRLADEERKRLEKEQKERDEKRRAAEMARIRQEDMKKQLDDLKASGKGLNIKEEDLEDLDSTRLRAMKLAQLEKEKSDLSEKLRIVGKRIDHLERAYRKREIELLNDDFERQKVEDQEIHARIKEETIQAAKEKHRYDLALKHRLSRIVSFYEDFTDEIKGKRHDEFEKRRKTAEQELQKAIDKRKKEYREAKLAERRALEEAAEREREAEEAAEREAAEKTAKEEELRKRLAEEKAKREESRRKMDEIAELQRKREEEAEERRRNKMAGAGRTESPAPAATGGTRAPLVLSGRTGVPSWREREAMKKAGGGGDSERSATPSAARDESPAARTQSPAADGPSKYTPPARRGAAPADSAEKPKEEVQRWRPSGRGRGGVAGERTDSSTRTESGNRTTGGRWRD